MGAAGRHQTLSGLLHIGLVAVDVDGVPPKLFGNLADRATPAKWIKDRATRRAGQQKTVLHEPFWHRRTVRPTPTLGLYPPDRITNAAEHIGEDATAPIAIAT